MRDDHSGRLEVTGWMRVVHWRSGCGGLGIVPFSIGRISRPHSGSGSRPRVVTLGYQNPQLHRYPGGHKWKNRWKERGQTTLMEDVVKASRVAELKQTGKPQDSCENRTVIHLLRRYEHFLRG